MRILVTNDDGYQAPGIAALIEAMQGLGEITVVAPEKNHSGASSSLTLRNAIDVHERGERYYIVAGTPTDCIHLALSGNFLPHKPDLIVSGINDGSNMGDDTIYSGTVAAAIEGHLFNIAAIAFSMANKQVQHFATGAAVARQLVQHFCANPPPGIPLYNVNIPDIALDQLGAIVPTRLGRRHIAQPAVFKKKKENCLTYQIGEAGNAKDDAPGSDFAAVQQGMVSVSPLMIDLTATAELDTVADWLKT
ncbi:MAG: 5'/3'-nucleotidase SurE [Proteobacteria bacterium]|nr:5'/3'-nucleotidase SurE [Pseudomonadota bacterium]